MQGLLPTMWGPVCLMTVLLDEDGFTAELMSALVEAASACRARVVDCLLIERTATGELRTAEVDADEFRLAGAELAAPGLMALSDADELAVRVSAGAHAVILALEMDEDASPAVILGRPAERLVAVVRIPANVANAVAELIAESE